MQVLLCLWLRVPAAAPHVLVRLCLPRGLDKKGRGQTHLSRIGSNGVQSRQGQAAPSHYHHHHHHHHHHHQASKEAVLTSLSSWPP